MLSGHGGGGIDEFDNQLNDPNQYDNPQDPASLSVAEHLCALTIRGKLVLVYIVGLLLWMLCKDWVSLFYRLSLPCHKWGGFSFWCVSCPIALRFPSLSEAIRHTLENGVLAAVPSLPRPLPPVAAQSFSFQT